MSTTPQVPTDHTTRLSLDAHALLAAVSVAALEGQQAAARGGARGVGELLETVGARLAVGDAVRAVREAASSCLGGCVLGGREGAGGEGGEEDGEVLHYE